MLPLVVGIFATSISSGQIMSRTGRYKWMPITGSAAGRRRAVRPVPARRSTPRTRYLAVIMFLFGAGLGLTMQVVVTAVQNSVDRKDMGAATASVDLLPVAWAARSARPCSAPS